MDIKCRDLKQARLSQVTANGEKLEPIFLFYAKKEEKKALETGRAGDSV